MAIPRLQLVELEDLRWFPATIRDLATDYLRFAQERLRFHAAVLPLLHDLVTSTGATTIVDLCAGGGGPMPMVMRDLGALGWRGEVVLTDRYPNVAAFREAAATAPGSIGWEAEPVDARAIPATLRGVRTLWNAFHHFAPADAIAVLRDAARAGDPVVVLELPDRRLVRGILPFVLVTPWAVLLATPFIRPFRWRRLLWTYVVPLVPLTCWWDGIVSALRAYD
nr:hypothetical protein [Gemmatimonadaceae bacterium]